MRRVRLNFKELRERFVGAASGGPNNSSALGQERSTETSILSPRVVGDTDGFAVVDSGQKEYMITAVDRENRFITPETDTSGTGPTSS